MAHSPECPPESEARIQALEFLKGAVARGRAGVLTLVPGVDPFEPYGSYRTFKPVTEKQVIPAYSYQDGNFQMRCWWFACSASGHWSLRKDNARVIDDILGEFVYTVTQ